MKNIFLVLLLGVVVSSYAQKTSDAVASQFMEYTNLIIEKQLEKAVEYTNEEVFKLVSKEQLVSALKTLYDSPEMDFSIKNPKNH